MTASDFSGIYREIAEIIGVEATLLWHQHFTQERSNLKMIASEFGYTERRLRQILKECGSGALKIT